MLGRFDLLLTDPPYGLSEKWESGGWKGAKRGEGKLWQADVKNWDNETPPRWLIEQSIHHAEKAIVWGGNYFAMPPARGWLSWDKVQEYSGGDFELAWTNLDTAPRVFRMSRIDAHQNKSEYKKEHPTEKPMQLISWCIGLAGDVETILDPFAGSGTTGRAAKDLGKKAVLIEREEKYCEIATQRLAQEVLDLF
jgi:DNA modification methylase